ncbi:hypothetical protein M3Y94_01015100 [Aphelenchoides besseyi]|nr:hypothetical protein M3Y94_01015100 [Aphelenchoides besseyi]
MPQVDDRNDDLAHLESESSIRTAIPIQLSDFTAEIGGEVFGRKSEFLVQRRESISWSRVRFEPTTEVLEIVKRRRVFGFSKASERQIPNAYRRYGPLQTLHSIGGWIQSKHHQPQFIERGSKPPRRPRDFEFSLNSFCPPAQVPNVIAFPVPKSANPIHQLAIEIAVRCSRFQSELVESYARPQTQMPQKSTVDSSSRSTSSSTSKSGGMFGRLRRRFSRSK